MILPVLIYFRIQSCTQHYFLLMKGFLSKFCPHLLVQMGVYIIYFIRKFAQYAKFCLIKGITLDCCLSPLVQNMHSLVILLF